MNTLIEIAREFGPYLLGGVRIALELTLVGMTLGLILGLFLALAQLSQFRLLTISARVFIEVVRGTPALVQLFLMYFGLASVGLVLSPFVAASATFAILGGAFMAEIFRSGIQAVDPGQTDAAKTIGMSYWTTMRFIIVPQATRIVLPPIANEAIQMLKGTSIVLVIGVSDITFRAYDVSSTTYRSMPVLILAALIYLMLAYPMSVGVRRLEARLGSRSQADLPQRW